MRRPDPARIFEAKRAGLRGRMVASRHVREADADQLLDAWDAEADARELARGDPRYWSDGEPWLRDKAGVTASGPADPHAVQDVTSKTKAKSNQSS